jgi:hypothetical protein
MLLRNACNHLQIHTVIFTRVRTSNRVFNLSFSFPAGKRWGFPLFPCPLKEWRPAPWRRMVGVKVQPTFLSLTRDGEEMSGSSFSQPGRCEQERSLYYYRESNPGSLVAHFIAYCLCWLNYSRSHQGVLVSFGPYRENSKLRMWQNVFVIPLAATK